MDEVEITNNEEHNKDFLDQLSYFLPWHRSLTLNERILIVIIFISFVSIIGCTLFCFVCSRFPLRRRYYSKKKFDAEENISIAPPQRKETIVLPAPPRYESIVNNNDKLNLERKFSYGTTSDTDVGNSNNNENYPISFNGNVLHFQSTQSSSSMINENLLPPFAQINLDFNIDREKHLLIIHLTNGENISLHPAFDEQSTFLIHVQILNNQILKKFNDIQKKRHSNIQLAIWKKQQEKTTKKLSRTSDGTLECDEYLQFELNKEDIQSSSLRFLFFAIDRSGIQDLMFESLIRLNSSMIPNYQQIIQFKDLPQITFAEIFLGISYLPTSERFTIKINKLRYFFRTEKDEKIDARLITTFFHRGRRVFQKKLPSIISDESITNNNNTYEIKDIITQNIPQMDIQSICVHIELIIHLFNSKDETILSFGSILLGQHTCYESDWQKLIEQPRQIHLGWYKFFV